MNRTRPTCRVLVCGGRDYADSERVFAVLSMYHDERNFVVLMQGGATGADSEAALWAKYHPEVRCLTFPANWRKHGKAAGPIRNRHMLAEGKPNLVIAFAGGRGTADMVALARGEGVEIIMVGAPVGARALSPQTGPMNLSGA